MSLASLPSPGISQESQAQFPPPLLTNIAQIKRLSLEQASEGRPASVQATVTFHSPSGACFIQDSTDAIYLVRSAREPSLNAGDRIQLKGTAAPGDYAPVLREVSTELLGSGALPKAEPVEFSQLTSGERDCKRVEVEGVVRWVIDVRPNHLMVQVALPEGRLRAYLYRWAEPDPQLLVGATVSLRGAVGASFNRKRQLVAPFLYVDSPADVLVKKQASLEDSPLMSASALLQYATPGQIGNLVRVRGTVLYQEPGQFLYIRDGVQGLQLLSLSTERVSPGTVVEARGFPGMGAYSPILEDAEFRKVDQGPDPASTALKVEEVMAGRGDADLVTIEAELIDSVQRENELILILQESNVLFSAHQPVNTTGHDDNRLRRHSRLRLTGVCSVQETKEQAARLVPVSFRLLMRSPEDTVIVRQPPWWTPARLLGALLVLASAALGAAVWAWTLRRKVREQTTFISERLRHEAALEERTRVARELHDSIEQNLAGIAMQMDTAAAKFVEAPGTASRLLDASRHLMRRTQEELHSSVWDLRSHLLQSGGLEAALKDLVQSLKRAGIQAGLTLSGPPSRLSSVTENHLLRIAQESCTNALRHSQATSVSLDLRVDSGKMLLRISDNGVGFEVTSGDGYANGHFGLFGMRERAEKLGGQLLVQSAPGKGTLIVVEAPLPKRRRDTQPDSVSPA